MVLTEDATIARAAELMEAEIGDELVALDVQKGLCFGFNGPATSVWRLIEQPRTVGEIKRALLDEYDVGDAELDADLSQLLRDMVSRGLVTSR